MGTVKQLNIARIANAVPCHSLFKGHNVNVNIVVLNCQKCNQCLKCQVSAHKSLGLLFDVDENLKFSENLKIF